MGSHVTVFFGFLATWLLVDVVIMPLQKEAFGVQSWASLLYLPHGVRVIAAWFMGWRAVPALFAASVAGHIATSEAIDGNLILFSSLSSSLCAVIAVKLMTASLPCLSRQREGEGIWRAWLLVALLASLLNTFGQVIALVYAGEHMVFARPADLMHMFNITIGDLTGMITLMAGLTLVFRWQRGSRGV